ncbi:hypothetical protein T03_11983 [Trichinella britovi]|uniref:PiggyBac transposable element-derived protein domain-containing protein n=1 Tax=Trichinella britovi TaxID=45882 RepID=A0A0V1D3G3_TRIBR|nr:hypothetical protein T03_11983 [Trichinella britovi]
MESGIKLVIKGVNPKDKYGKYGVKINWICDAENGYALKGSLYNGRSSEERQIGLASTNIGQLAQPFVNSNRNVFMDRYFTSYSIEQRLLGMILQLLVQYLHICSSMFA